MSNALNEKPGVNVLPRSTGASILLNGRYLPPPHDRNGRQWIRATALIQADPMKLYSMWRDVGSAPSWQEEITSVTETGTTTSHWVMVHGGKTMEWESQLIADEPGRRLAWTSISGDIDNAGEVVFEDSPGSRGTLVVVLQEFKMSKLKSSAATITGRNPQQSVVENLRHFKAMAETGEIPRTEPQPHGERGIVGGIKKSMYGEKIATPPDSPTNKD